MRDYRYHYIAKIGIIAVSLFFLLTGCHSNKTTSTGSIVRFEKMISTLPAERILDSLQISHPEMVPFFRVFNVQIVRIGPDTTLEYKENLEKYLNDPVIREIFARIQKNGQSIDRNLIALESALERIKRAIPSMDQPKIVTYVGGFNQSFLTLPGVLAIGLENYLEDTCSLYVNLGIPVYLRNRMKPENLPADAIRAWTYSELPPLSLEAGFLDNLVYQGKTYFLIHKLLPDLSEGELFQYSVKQAAWCRQNEKAMWRFLAEKQALFSTDRFTIRKFFDEAPFTRDFGKDSPGRIGTWIGYRIICSYMKATGSSMEELFMAADPLKILSLSNYHP